MWRTLCFAVLLLIPTAAGLDISWGPFSGEEEADLGVLLPRLYQILPYLYYRVSELVGPDDVDFMAQLDELDQEHQKLRLDNPQEARNDTGPSDKCVECRALVGLLQAAVVNGDYYELEEAVLDLCYDIVNASDDLGIPEYICPGIVENYVSQAFVILNSTALSSQEICVLWNECIYTDFDPPMSEDTLVCRPPPLPATAKWGPKLQRTKKKRNLDDAIKIVHMTDIHVDLFYDIGSPTECGMPTCCRELWPGTGFAGYWGDYNCNQPIPISNLMFQFLSGQNISYVMYTGDNPPHTVWLDTYESQMNSSRALANSFRTNLPGVPVFYSLGNHDIHPTNLYYYNRTDVQQGNIDLADIWGSLSGFQQEQIDTFQNGAYYSMLLRPGLRVLGYNSNFGWLENFYTMLPDHPDYDEMKVFMETTLASARQNGEKVILLGHHPTGQSAGNNEYSCYITDIHARYGDVIILHLSGHKHGDLYRLVRDITTGETRGVQISSPAGGTRSDRNPSIRIFYVDPDMFDILDADTYRVNITMFEGMPDGSVAPQVEFGYRFSEEYNMVDLSPASFEDFILRMESDDDLFIRYLWNESTGNYARFVDNSCDAECKFEEICQMMNTAYPGYLVCTGEI